MEVPTLPPSLRSNEKRPTAAPRNDFDVYMYAATLSGGRSKKSLPENVAWVQPAELANYPLSTTGRKISRLLAD